MTVIALTGRGGGKLAERLGDQDMHICVPHERTARIQEVHILVAALPVRRRSTRNCWANRTTHDPTNPLPSPGTRRRSQGLAGPRCSRPARRSSSAAPVGTAMVATDRRSAGTQVDEDQASKSRPGGDPRPSATAAT